MYVIWYIMPSHQQKLHNIQQHSVLLYIENYESYGIQNRYNKYIHPRCNVGQQHVRSIYIF